ncbi:7TM diverse intracellular signaling domain-containing protein [Flavobacterium sp.]|uniref:7TM diverse intracellular signaling domain-containing protein n=1 Tax=Flavobacterium sp. TaxID=239 RepID=UPI004033F8C4
METLKIFSGIGLVILCINVIIYLIGFFRNEKAYKYFSLYLLAIGVVQLIMQAFALRNQNNHFLSNYYLFSQFILLSIFFYNLFLGVAKRKSHLIMATSVITTIGLVIQYSVYPDNYFTFNSLGLLITSVILIAYSVLYLYELLGKKLPFHFVTIGLFIYLISSALIFASATSLVSINDEFYVYIWNTNAILFIIYQLLVLWEWKQRFLPRITHRH